MSKIICVECSEAMKVDRNGVAAIEHYDSARDRIYRIWQADRFICPKCGKMIVANFAKQSTESYEPGFTDVIASAKRGEFIEFH